jgi:hypothetical protein
MLVSALWLLLFAQAPASSCGVSRDAAFATTREQAVQVGGGAMYAAARERRYLDALRGPGGEPLQYRRRGSLPLGPNSRTILDEYEVTYTALPRPATLYLDAYHFDDALVAPKGFVCAVPFGLTPPGPDPFLASDAMRELAIEQGGAREIAPIPLDADGSAAHGILLDSFRLLARAARAAAVSGTRLDPRNLPRDLMLPRTIAIAYPIRCSGKDAAPAAIDLIPGQGARPRRDGDPLSGEALARLLPGMPLPTGALGARYLLERPRVGDTLRITYPEPCGELVLPLAFTNGRAVNTPPAALPPGAEPTDRPVRIQAVIDLDGAIRQGSYVGGPERLADAAIAGLRDWSAEPVRLNGAPLPTAIVVAVRFR